MINFRKAWCKTAKKGGFWYKLLDCQRYVPPVPPESGHAEVGTTTEGPVQKRRYIGTSVYQLVIYPWDDIVWFLNECKSHGATCSEIFFDFTWQGGYRWQPFDLVGKWEELEKDGKNWLHLVYNTAPEKWIEMKPDEKPSYPGTWFPLFDLTKFDETAWAKWIRMFQLFKELNLTLFIRVMDQCSLKDAVEKRYNAFRSNVQRLDHKTLTGGLYGEPIKQYYQALCNRLVAELMKVGVDYFIVPWNEFDVIKNGWTDEDADRIALGCMSWWVDMLEDLGVKKDRIIISTSRKYETMASWGYRMEVHGCNSDYTMTQYCNDFNEPVFFNGDGPDFYGRAMGEAGDKPNKREPSVNQAVAMGRLIEDRDLFGYATFNRPVEQTDPSNLSRAKFDVLEALVGK